MLLWPPHVRFLYSWITWRTVGACTKYAEMNCNRMFGGMHRSISARDTMFVRGSDSCSQDILAGPDARLIGGERSESSACWPTGIGTKLSSWSIIVFHVTQGLAFLFLSQPQNLNESVQRYRLAQYGITFWFNTKKTGKFFFYKFECKKKGM